MTCPSEGLLPMEAVGLELGVPTSCSFHPVHEGLSILADKLLGPSLPPAHAWAQGKCSGNAGRRQVFKGRKSTVKDIGT